MRLRQAVRPNATPIHFLGDGNTAEIKTASAGRAIICMLVIALVGLAWQVLRLIYTHDAR